MTDEQIIQFRILQNKLKYLQLYNMAAVASKEALESVYSTTTMVITNKYAPKGFMDVYISNLNDAEALVKKEFENLL